MNNSTNSMHPCPCRFIVTQHRQTVNVQDPARLASFLELLIGTSGFGERVGRLQKELEQSYAAQEEAEAEADRCARLGMAGWSGWLAGLAGRPAGGRCAGLGVAGWPD